MKFNWRDVFGAAALFVVSTAFLVASTTYDFGTASQMGPAYFPMLMAGVGITISILLLLAARNGSDESTNVSWRPFVAVLSAVGAFAVTMNYLGMGPAIFATVAVSAFADRQSRFLSTALLALLLIFGAWIVFVLALRLPIPMIQVDF